MKAVNFKRPHYPRLAPTDFSFHDNKKQKTKNNVAALPGVSGEGGAAAKSGAI
jgi:hypothetical protein